MFIFKKMSQTEMQKCHWADTSHLHWPSACLCCTSVPPTKALGECQPRTMMLCPGKLLLCWLRLANVGAWGGWGKAGRGRTEWRENWPMGGLPRGRGQSVDSAIRLDLNSRLGGMLYLAALRQ